MKRTIITMMTLAALLPAAAQQAAGTLALPLVFDSYREVAAVDTIAVPDVADRSGAATDMAYAPEWLTDANSSASRQSDARYRAALAHPELVEYNSRTLPEAPKAAVIEAAPELALLTIDTPPVEAPADVTAPVAPPAPIHNWLHTFDGSLHFTQAYISPNWYQGGENNLNILADVKWTCNLNQEVHPNWLFNNLVQYKLGVSTAHADSLRNYAINEDNFLFTSQLGYKAVKHWYYSAMLQFKTQFFNNYKENTRDMTAAFLSPGELNLGLGMTYEYKSKDGDKVFTLAIAPFSYNLKICRNITDIDPTTFGIKAGHHTKSDFGSNVEAKLMMKLGPNITWNSRLYVFTNYKYVQGDFENTFDFTITKYLTTKIFVHLRYDKSHTWNKSWKYWQLKEILSFGLAYRFATI